MRNVKCIGECYNAILMLPDHNCFLREVAFLLKVYLKAYLCNHFLK